MSRSNNTDLKSPAKKFFEWNGGDGGFRYFDKTLGEADASGKPKGANVQVPYPFRFLVLDQLTTIRGFSDADQSGFWSNEIRDVKSDLLTVRTKKGIEMTGTYEQVKEKLGAKGADYCKSVYIAYKEGDQTVIGNLAIKGSAIGPWIDFCKSNDVNKIGVQVDSHTAAKKGKTEYFVPVFRPISVTPETDAKAIELDKELQEYLKACLSRNGSSTASVQVSHDEEMENAAPAQTPQQASTEAQAPISGGIGDNRPLSEIAGGAAIEDGLPF